MDHLDVLRWIYRGLLILAAITSIAVPVIYHRRSGGLWRKSQWGRHLFGSDTTLAVIFTFLIFASFFPRNVAYVTSIVLLVAYIWYRIARVHLIVKSQVSGEQRQMLEQREEDLT